MKKRNSFVLVFICLFVVLLSTTIFISFSSNTNTEEVIVKSITPVYDSNSTIVVDDNNVVFNDKNQTVEYKVVIENTQNYDVKVDEFFLSSPSEEFLDYTIKNIENDDVIEANSTKELILSLETTGIKGWGRNFNDELIANISFEKLSNTVKPPEKHPTSSDDTIDKEDEVETPEEEVKAPEKPAQSIQEVINKSEKIEISKVTKDTIEFKKTEKLQVNDKIAVWLYSDPIFLGYFDVVEKDGIKQIVGLETALQEAGAKTGEHHIVLVTEENETIGYVEVYVDDNKVLSQDSSEDGKIENPYTSGYGLLTLALSVSGTVVVGIFLFSRKKPIKYIVLVLALSSTLTLVKAEETIELPIALNVSFESQNVMKMAYILDENDEKMFQDYWSYAEQIKNFYIKNQKESITEYTYEFDVTEEQNGRVMAYLVTNADDSSFYDVYLMADGIIYPNTNANYYFANMKNIKSINNLEGFDTQNVTSMQRMFNHTGSSQIDFELNLSSFNTSNVINMSGMFARTASSTSNFVLDLSSFDTSNVTDMSGMFNATAADSTASLEIDVSSFDTSNVVNMSYMFAMTGQNVTSLTLDISNFDTSSVTDMSNMFNSCGKLTEDFILDVSNFNTSNVTDMSGMFISYGANRNDLVLDLSSFDTSKVTNMSYMFNSTGKDINKMTLLLDSFDTSNVTDMSGMFMKTCEKCNSITLDISNFDTSQVTDMSYMFAGAGYNSENFLLNVSNFDTSNVTDMSSMFYNVGYNNPNFILDVSDFDTSNVKNMSSMFYNVGYNNPNFTLDVSDFDTSKVINMNYMFLGTGYNSTILNTTITISNPNVKYFTFIFNSVAINPNSKITVNYTSKTSSLVDHMLATKSSSSNVVKGDLVRIIADDISVGDEIAIGAELFNVIKVNNASVTMLAKYNLGSDFKQSTINNYVTFSDKKGWESTPGPKEIDIQTWSNNPKSYVNEYVTYLQGVIGDIRLVGDLITLTELNNLGCTMNDDYTYASNLNCLSSYFKYWLINGQNWWTRSVVVPTPNAVWGVTSTYSLTPVVFDRTGGIRPVITISVQALKNYLEA